MVPYLAVLLQGVEECAENRKGETGAVGRRGSDGRGEMAAYLRKEYVDVGRLSYQVDKEVIGCYEFCTAKLVCGPKSANFPTLTLFWGLV